MEDITFLCKHCGHELVCEAKGAGQIVPCPECGQHVTIPTVSTPETVKEALKKTFKVNRGVTESCTPSSSPQQYQQSNGKSSQTPIIIILVLLLIGVILASVSFFQSMTRFEYTQNMTRLQLECTQSIAQSLARLQLDCTKNLEYTKSIEQNITRRHVYEYTHITFPAGGHDRTGYSALKYASINFDKSVMSKMGSDGWEMVGCYLEMETAFPNLGTGEYVTGLQPNIRPQCLVVIFKRRI